MTYEDAAKTPVNIAMLIRTLAPSDREFMFLGCPSYIISLQKDGTYLGKFKSRYLRGLFSVGKTEKEANKNLMIQIEMIDLGWINN